MANVEPVPTDLLIEANLALRGRVPDKDATKIITELSHKYPVQQVSNGLVRLQGLMAIVSEVDDSPWVTTFEREGIRVVNEAMFHAAARARLWSEGDGWVFDMLDFDRIALLECQPMGTA